MRKFLTIVLVLCFSLSADAWSTKEHQMMAYMAQQHLTPNTKAFLERYLDQSLAQYASWMDRYRHSPGYEQTHHWHMVSVAEDGSFPDNGSGKALPSINESIRILSNYKEYDDSTVRINLVYLSHLVPEIHCPAHYSIASQKKIVNLLFKGKSTSYHHLWDCSVTTLHPGMKYTAMLEYFDTWSPEKQIEVSNGTPEDWCRDNFSRIKYVNGWVQSGETLPDDFLEMHRDLVENHFRLGAYRLARVLNDLFDKAE